MVINNFGGDNYSKIRRVINNFWEDQLDLILRNHFGGNLVNHVSEILADHLGKNLVDHISEILVTHRGMDWKGARGTTEKKEK